MRRLRFWLAHLLECHHGHFEYEDAGGKACVYNQVCNKKDCENACSGECSIPVYEVYCKDCGMSWTVGEDEVMDFFAKKKRGDDPNGAR